MAQQPAQAYMQFLCSVSLALNLPTLCMERGFFSAWHKSPQSGISPPPIFMHSFMVWLQVLKGKDPEGANVLLQCLAKAADVLQMDGADAVAVRLSRKQISCIKPVHRF